MKIRKNNADKVQKILILILLVLGLVMLILEFMTDETLKIENKEKTTGQIVDIVNIKKIIRNRI